MADSLPKRTSRPSKPRASKTSPSPRLERFRSPTWFEARGCTRSSETFAPVLLRRTPGDLDMPVDHLFGQRRIGRISFENRAVGDERRTAARQANLMAIERVAMVFDDDVGVLFENRDQFLV